MRRCLNSSILNSFSYFKLASLFDIWNIVVLDWSNANFFKFIAKLFIACVYFLKHLSALSMQSLNDRLNVKSFAQLAQLFLKEFLV